MTSGADAATGPLQGIRVLDLTSVVMGPLATRTLGDLGADVITVESPGGERNRTMGPGPHDQFSGIALNLMRSKRSVALNLKMESGRQAFLDIAATCDAMVTNLRPGPVKRLGLDYSSVRAVRPDVVYCQAHGFPADSELAEEPAYDDIIQSATGIGDVFVRAGLEATLAPMLIADKVVGMAVANAVLAALLHRARTHEGQFVEVPMIDAMRAFMLVEHGAGAISEPPVAAPGYTRVLTPERRPQRTLDGWINVLPYEVADYVAIFTDGGRADVATDERFRTRRGRLENSDSLYRDVSAILTTRTTGEWRSFCRARGIAAAKAATLEALLAELPVVDHPAAGRFRLIPSAERFSATPLAPPGPAPTIGQHGRAILSELGYDSARLDS